MKKIAYSILAAMLLFTGTLAANAQSDENRNVSGFNGIASSGPFDVHVNINGTESLKISGAADIVKKIQTVVEDGVLKIKFENHRNWDNENYGKIEIWVTAKSLSSLTNAGLGSIKVEGTVGGEETNITLSGSGSITSTVKSDMLHTTISGSGSIHLNGHANDTKIQISGSGELKARELKTGSANVSIAGSGNAYFTAEKTVSAHIAGSGNVIYSGTATIAESKMIGSGSVTRE